MNALEIDYLAVGDGTRSGDAIALRFGDYENGVWKSQTIFTIDGGNKDSGERLIEHITEIYKSDKIDRAILTHPDSDHASGMQVLVENMKVGKIWMHRPWNHWDDIKDSIYDGRITKKSFSETLKEAYQYAYNVEQVALKKKIDIFAPHQGCTYNVNNERLLTVLAPGKDFYLDLIRQSQKTPEMTVKEVFEKSVTYSENKKEAFEDMTFETENLTVDHGETSSENNMSLIMLLEVAGKRVLFTGDSGTMGIYKALEYSIKNNIILQDLDILHVPHHGSRRNISQGILTKISAKKAYISCSQEGAPSHPSAIVTNAFIRRGTKVFCTKGKGLRYHTSNLSDRAGWGPATPVAFNSTVLIDK